MPIRTSQILRGLSPRFGGQRAEAPNRAILTVTVADGSEGNTVAAQNNTNHFDGSAWTHIAATWTASTLILFVNGVNQDSESFTSGGPASISAPLVFGDPTYVTSPNTPAWTMLDEIRISNIVRYTSAGFDPQTAKCFLMDGNTLAYYRCNEGTGTSVGDQTGNYNATWAGTPTWVSGVPCLQTSSSSSTEDKSSSSSSTKVSQSSSSSSSTKVSQSSSSSSSTKVSVSSSSSSTAVSVSSSSSIAGDQIVQLGTSVTITPKHSGELWLAFNDNTYGDNSGSFTVSINGGTLLTVSAITGSGEDGHPNTSAGIDCGPVTKFVPVTVTASGTIDWNTDGGSAGPNGTGGTAGSDFWAPGLRDL